MSILFIITMVDDETYDWMDMVTSEEKSRKIEDYALRSLYGLDSGHSLHPAAISNKLANDFDNLRQSNWEARPHLNLEIDADDFITAIDEALGGERKSFSIGKHGDVDVNPHLRNGFVNVNIKIQEFEIYLSTYETGDRAGKLSQEELEIIEEYYESGSVHIQQRPSRDQRFRFTPLGYITLLRDMSEDCRRVADVMFNVVDEYEDLHWEEPQLRDSLGSYLFISTLHYRGE